MSALHTPPMEPLVRVSAALASAGVPHALGGSAMCASLGLLERVNDWDITCEADPDVLAALFAGERSERFGNSGCHADHKLNLEDGMIELIARFAFRVPDGIVHIPTRVTANWRGVPVGSPEGWAVAYALMGELEDSPRRRERADLLLAHLAEHGADGETIRVLLAEPLPNALAARLEALPQRA